MPQQVMWLLHKRNEQDSDSRELTKSLGVRGTPPGISIYKETKAGTEMVGFSEKLSLHTWSGELRDSSCQLQLQHPDRMNTNMYMCEHMGIDMHTSVPCT